jgi:hypothetical protein
MEKWERYPYKQRGLDRAIFEAFDASTIEEMLSLY